MGAKGSRLRGRSKSANVLVLGLDGSGKTAVLNKLARGHPHNVHQVVATHGCGVVRVATLGFRLNCFDVGGGESSRSVWPSHFAKAHAVVFVIDSTDRARIEKAGLMLQGLLEDAKLAGVPLLILANKQDLWSAVSGTEIADGLNCSQIRGRLWQIQQTSAVTGEGVQAAFAWVTRTISERALSAKEIKRIKFAAELH